MAKKSQKKKNVTQTADTAVVSRELTDMQELFIHEYLVDMNATQAAIRAGYSSDTAAEQASRLLSNVNIKKRVQDLLKAKFTRIDMTAERILLELFRMATVDISEAYDSHGTLKPIHEIPEDVRRCIASIEVAEIFNGEGDDRHVVGLNKKFKFTNKEKAGELLAKHFKLLTDTLVIKDEMGLAKRLAKARGKK